MRAHAKVRVDLDSRPESVTLVRAILSGLAECHDLDPELANDLKTAVSEACNNVVVHAYEGEAGPLSVDVELDGVGLTAIVRDRGVGFQDVAMHEDGMGVGLAVISALAARAEFATPADGGTEVRMWFPARALESRPLAHFDGPHHIGRVATGRRGGTPNLPGDVRVTVAPAALTAPVLGRLARAMAATARFSFDRFSDVYLIADMLGVHAQRAGTADRISFSLIGSSRRLELAIGPFARGTGDSLDNRADIGEASSPLSLLVDEITVAGDERAETVRVILRDRGIERSGRARTDT